MGKGPGALLKQAAAATEQRRSLQEDIQIAALRPKVKGFLNENWRIFWETVELTPLAPDTDVIF